MAKLSKRKRQAREEKQQEEESAAKAARLQEEIARAPLGRGHRAAAAAAAPSPAELLFDGVLWLTTSTRGALHIGHAAS